MARTQARERARILIVDDEELIRDMLADFLCMEGYAVDTAGDGVAALEVMDRHHFDIVISDMKMPRLGGLGLLSEVGKTSPETRTILMTGFGTVESAVDAMKRGAHDYILKPFRVEQVALVVRKALAAKNGAPHSGIRWADDGEAELMGHVSNALDTLYMHYQPIVRASDGSVYGFEALMRNNEATLLNPATLLEASERLGVTQKLGRSVRDLVAQDTHEAPGEALLFVNLHPSDLLDPALFSASAPLTKIAPRVVLEITERASLQDVDDATRRVASLREMGFRIAIDDLGAGYAGLTSFAQLEPEIVKLDMSLVRKVNDNNAHRRVVASMTKLATDMGMMVVAEGIEKPEEHAALIDIGVDLLQGFHFGRPDRFPT